jgi:hypothetical protein
MSGPSGPVTRLWPRLAVAVALGGAVLAACALEPDVGPLLAGTCKNADRDPDHSVSFSGDIRPLFNRMMAGCGCHMPSASGPGAGTQLSGLDLSSLAALRAGGANSGSRIVVAGEPCSSILYLKIEQAPPFGARMPLGGPPFFTDEEEDLLHDWISEGAANN